MESLHQEQACSAGSGLRMTILQRNASSLLPDLCSNSSICKITDETFPYISGILDDTMDPSFMSNGPLAAATGLSDQVQVKTLPKAQDEDIPGAGSQTKAAYNSWLSMPMEHGHSVDLSMSITSALNDHEDMANVTESNPKRDVPDASCHSLESSSCTEKCDYGVESKNSTFDMAKDLKERFSGLNLTKPVRNETSGSGNVTFEKSEELQEKSSGLSCTISNDDVSLEDKRLNEKPLNSTVDVGGPSNSITEQPNQKLNGTVEITQSNGPKHEQSNEGRTCSKHCEKQSTFTKDTEENNAAVDMSAGVATGVVQPGSVNVLPVDRTFTKHNATTDLTPPEPVSDLTNATINKTKSSNTELPMRSDTNCGATDKDTPVSEPSAPVNTAAPVRVDVTDCSDRTLDLPETDCKEVQQDPFRRRNGISDGECYVNLDISQSSMFSLDDMLDLKPCPLVASTPIVLGRGFDRLASAKPTKIQKQLSVINSINTQLNDDTAGVSEHEGSDASKPNQLSVKSDTRSQTQKVPVNGTSNSTTETAIVNKPPSKLAVRRKIPQPSFKSSIPKTQLLQRPPTLQVTSAAVKSKTAAGAQALNQLATSSSALHSLKRTVQFNKGKTLASAKNSSTASTVKCSSVATSTSTCNLTADKKNTCVTLPKPSGLQLPGRGRFGLKPPGSAVSSEETGHTQANSRPTGLSAIKTRNSLLPGFSQKHASSDALPVAKRKKTDLQNQPSGAEAPAGSEAGAGVQKNETAPTDISLKRPNTDCGNCLLLEEKLRTFHEELGGFCQELGQLPADCKKWSSLQQKLESYLEEVKRLQMDHH